MKQQLLLGIGFPKLNAHFNTLTYGTVTESLLLFHFTSSHYNYYQRLDSMLPRLSIGQRNIDIDEYNSRFENK